MSRRSKALIYVVLSWPPHAMGYVVVPVLLSRVGRRHGWTNGRPSPYNRAGVTCVAGGASLIAWAIVSHYRGSPDRVEARLTPNYLVTNGAYGRTRNPLYLGGVTMWAGWAILFGSLPVTVGGLVLWSSLAGFGIPFEERLLTTRFGDQYATYRTHVPRWLNLHRSHA